MPGMDALEALRQSSREFETRLRQVGDDEWDLPTPCVEWNVRELVNHMLLGTRMSVQLLAGASREDAIAALGEDMMATSQDPVADFVDLATQMQAGVAAGLDGTVDHPMGQIPRTMFIGFRIMDNGTHAWDLARDRCRRDARCRPREPHVGRHPADGRGSRRAGHLRRQRIGRRRRRRAAADPLPRPRRASALVCQERP